MLAQKWNGKEILLPERATFTRLLTDTAIPEISQAGMKILVYMDTTDCMGCKLQLDGWEEFMMEVKAATQDTIPFLFFFFRVIWKR
ncbi:MAG: hypothetical protein LUD15_15010 [Bacteroides sp.]|nr:hypothetical protein [Bacteroides sp.]